MSENMDKWRHLDGSEAVVNQPYIKIQFQHGNPFELGENGCSLEDVIEVLIQKLLGFQGRDLACRENAVALWYLSAAQDALSERVRRREDQGVRGSKLPHSSPNIDTIEAPMDTFPSFLG